jgi:hypothetical protein
MKPDNKTELDIKASAIAIKAVKITEKKIKDAPKDVKEGLAIDLINTGLELLAEFKILSPEEKEKYKAGIPSMIFGFVLFFHAIGDFIHKLTTPEVPEVEEEVKTKKKAVPPKV